MSQTQKQTQKKMRKKIKIREFTNNERILITLLVIVILFWLSFKYIIEPQNLKISILESELNNHSLHIEENNRILKNKKSILDERSKLSREKDNIEKEFFKSLNQPNIIYILNQILLKSDIDMDRISFSPPVVESLNEMDIEKMDILIPFTGDFKALNNIVKSIENENQKIVINTLDILKNEDTELAGNLNLEIYSLTGIVDGEDANLPIEVTTTNKANPFIPYRGYIDPNKVKENTLEGRPSEEETLVVQDESQDNEISNEGEIDEDMYSTYTAVKGDSIAYISMKKYGTEKYMDEILSLNGMKRSSILPIGKEIKLMELGK